MNRILVCLLALALPGTAARAAVYTLQPGPEGEDTAPYAFIPTLNRGQSPTLYAGTPPLDENGLSHTFETYLKFTLPSISASRVLNAYLRVNYAFDFGGFGEPSTEPAELACHRVLSAWSESSVTWNTRPTVAPAFAVVAPIDDLGYVTCDVTQLVKDWLSGAAANHGIALTNSTPRLIGMHSWEDTAVPADAKATLVIEASNPPPTGGCGMLGIEAWGAIALLERARRRRRAGVGLSSP
jgi:hypothetical protein